MAYGGLEVFDQINLTCLATRGPTHAPTQLPTLYNAASRLNARPKTDWDNESIVRIVDGGILMGSVLLTAGSLARAWTSEGGRAQPQHTCILQTGLGAADIFTDVMFAVLLFQIRDPLRFWYVASKLCSALFNGAFLVYTFRAEVWEFDVHHRFQVWMWKHFGVFTSVVTMSILDVQIVSVLTAQLGPSATNAPISSQTQQRLTIASSAASFVENVPQIVIQIYHLNQKSSSSGIALVATILSAFDIVQSMVGLATWVLCRVERPEDEKKYDTISMQILSNEGEDQPSQFKSFSTNGTSGTTSLAHSEKRFEGRRHTTF